MKSFKSFGIALLVILVALGGRAAADGAVFVNKGNTSGNEDGTSWATAFTTIRAGLDAAIAGGQTEVWVAGARYDELRPNSGKLILQSGISLFGGFAGTETARDQRDPAAHNTIIDGTTSNDGGTQTTQVVKGASNLTFDGFTVTGGHGDRGAGMMNDGPSDNIQGLVVSNCVFTGNLANEHGGGMYNAAPCEVVISHCTFTVNQATRGGGGMWNDSCSPVVTDCEFDTNLQKLLTSRSVKLRRNKKCWEGSSQIAKLFANPFCESLTMHDVK